MKFGVAFISNCLNQSHLEQVQNSQGVAESGFFKPFSCRVSGLKGGMFLVPSLPEDLLNAKGIREARKQFMAAAYAAQQSGAKVILLAASLKRLFGSSCKLSIDHKGNSSFKGKSLLQHFPDILFTNGDNGTISLFRMDIDSILSRAKMHTRQISPVVIGTGLLGVATLEYLIELGYPEEQIQVVTRHPANVQKLLWKNGMTIHESSSEISPFSNVIFICTHLKSQRLTADQLSIFNQGIYVLDVAVPYGLPEKEYQRCLRMGVDLYRQDGGNAYSENIIFDFHPELVGLHEHIFYGCFTEASILALELFADEANSKIFRKLDLFSVNKESRQLVEKLFKKHGFGLPPKPLCFNKEIRIQDSVRMSLNHGLASSMSN